MSDVKQLALEAFEGREEAEKRIPKVVEENLEDYVKKIIEIFKISNSSEKSTVLVWQVRLYYDSKYSQEEQRKCSVMLSFEQENETFYNKDVFGCVGYENNESLREYIRGLEIPVGEVQNIFKYFKENLEDYFEVEDIDFKYILIKLKRKNNPTNS